MGNPLRPPPVRDRAQGALMGLAVGDAMGAPAENMTAAARMASPSLHECRCCPLAGGRRPARRFSMVPSSLNPAPGNPPVRPARCSIHAAATVSLVSPWP